MSASDLVAQLAEAGTPPQLLAAVAQALFKAEAETAALEARRANDRERQARRHVNSRELTEDNVNDREDAGSPSLDKSPPDPKKLNLSLCVNNSSPRAREGYHRLPEGWKPTRPLPAKTQAKVDEWPPGALDDELAAMHRWALNAENKQGKGLKKDWDTAFHNWIERRHDERYRRANTMGGLGASADGLSSTARAAIAVFGPPTH